MITERLTGERIALSAVGVLFPWIALGSCIASFREWIIDVTTKPFLQYPAYRCLKYLRRASCCSVIVAQVQSGSSHCPDKQGLMAFRYTLGTRVCTCIDSASPIQHTCIWNRPAVSHACK